MRTRGIVVAAAVLAAAVSSLLGASPAQSATTWAPAASASIHPGVMMFTAGAQCTANFVYTDASAVYLGYAAHCAGTGEATETDGCLAASLPLGTPVEIDGATRPGTLAYSSWLTMQSLGETDADTCAYNDLALVRLDPADVVRTNPSIPHWGGPVALNTAGNPALASVYSYGNSSLRHVEADSLEKVAAALAAGADAILLDNLGVEGVREAVALADAHEGRRPLLEASGGITLDTIAAYAGTGVDVVSSSQITISAPVLDIGLDIEV